MSLPIRPWVERQNSLTDNETDNESLSRIIRIAAL